MRACGRELRLLPLLFSFVLTSAHLACRLGLSASYSGIFYANDSGVSHGGFEWAGEYTARLETSGEKGSLELQFLVGLGDALTRHRFSVSNFAEAAGSMTFTLEGEPAVLRLVDQDLIWSGRFDGYLSGNNSDDAGEQIGELPVNIFKGFKSNRIAPKRVNPAIWTQKNFKNILLPVKYPGILRRPTCLSRRPRSMV
jgi:hypothetical protein